MKLTFVVSRDELAAIASELVPARFVFKDERRGAVSFGRGLSIELVPATGLRVRGDARVAMVVAGLGVQVVVRGFAVLFRPTITSDATGAPSLAFDPVLEHLDLERVPTFLDERIRSGLNEALATQRRKLAWRFGARWGAARALPDRMIPSGTFRVSPSAASVVVTRDELRLAVELRPELVLRRPGALRTAEPAPPSSPRTPSSRSAPA